MEKQLNHPAKSKINWTSVAIQVVALLAIFDVFPKEAEAPIVEIVALVGPGLIQYFRTYKTGPR